MAVLNIQKITSDGLNPVFVAADAAGDEIPNGGRNVLHVKNGSAGQITVTINSQRACNQGFDHDQTVDIPAGEERVIGPFNSSRFNNSNGRVEAAYSAAANVTVAALEV